MNVDYITRNTCRDVRDNIFNCFKYEPILIYIGNIISGFEVGDMILMLKLIISVDIRGRCCWYDRYCRFWLLILMLKINHWPVLILISRF